jgi:hypothetical protein
LRAVPFTVRDPRHPLLMLIAVPFPISPRKSLLALDRSDATMHCMSTVAEIESAIERLQPTEVAELAAWLNEYQQMIQASAQIFAMYDREEEPHAKGPPGRTVDH